MRVLLAVLALALGALASAMKYVKLPDGRYVVFAGSPRYVLRHSAGWEVEGGPKVARAFVDWSSKSGLPTDPSAFVKGLQPKDALKLAGNIVYDPQGEQPVDLRVGGESVGVVHAPISPSAEFAATDLAALDEFAKAVGTARPGLLTALAGKNDLRQTEAWLSFLDRVRGGGELYLKSNDKTAVWIRPLAPEPPQGPEPSAGGGSTGGGPTPGTIIDGPGGGGGAGRNGAIAAGVALVLLALLVMAPWSERFRENLRWRLTQARERRSAKGAGAPPPGTVGDGGQPASPPEGSAPGTVGAPSGPRRKKGRRPSKVTDASGQEHHVSKPEWDLLEGFRDRLRHIGRSQSAVGDPEVLLIDRLFQAYDGRGGLEAQIAAFQAEVDRLKIDVAKLEGYRQYEEQAEEMNKRLTASQGRIVELEGKVNGLNTQVETLKTARTDADNKAEAAESAVAYLVAWIDERSDLQESRLKDKIDA